mmetsp:Transcript_62618/g.143498  ORF Transcript_62618/g.143498 Transcript_62618/m.143498 type:complete len:209 (-) Transcript_62618:750-1376(-)
MGGLHVEGEVEEQLLDRVAEQLLEPLAAPRDAIVPILRPGIPDRLRHGGDRALGGGGLAGERLEELLLVCYVRCRVLHRLLEDALEVVARPLDGVLDRVRKVLQRADRDRLLGGVARGGVGFRQVRDHHLDVALGAESAALEEGLLHVHAPLVHVRPRLDVIESVADAVEVVEEVISEDVLRVAPHPRLVRLHLEAGVHVRDFLARGG